MTNKELDEIKLIVENATMRMLQKHENHKHKSINLGNLITIVAIIGVGVAAFFKG